MATAPGIEASALASLSAESRTLHFDNSLSHGRMQSAGVHCTRAVRVSLRLQAPSVCAAPPGRAQPRPNVRNAPCIAHHRGEIRPDSRPKPSRVWQAQAGSIPGRLGRVCLAYSTRFPRSPVEPEECGGRRVALGDLSQIEASSCGSRSDRNLRGLNRRVDCTHFRPWPIMGT